MAAQATPPPSEPEWEPPWEQAFASPPEPTSYPEPDEIDEQAFIDDHPDWEEEPPEPVDDTITLKPDDRVPVDAGELLRTYYAPGIGDMRVYTRLSAEEMDIAPDQLIDAPDLINDFNLHFNPKGPKKPK